MPKRIQMSRQHAWRPGNPNAVIVARRSRWGNPYKVGTPSIPDRRTAVDLYRLRLQLDPGFSAQVRLELAGKDLACWCPLDQPCHADVLLALANGDE